MTEAEWLACEDPDALLDYLRQLKSSEGIETSERKLRLLACAFCRRIWHLLPDELSRSTVELCEYYVDGLAEHEAVFGRSGFSTAVKEHIYDEGTVEREAYFAARWVCSQLERVTGPNPHSPEEGAAGYTADCVARAEALSGTPAKETARGLCAITRDVIGNPFHRTVDNPEYRARRCTLKLVRYQPASFAPEWRTDTVLALAQGMYESRDFSAMPILADALQDAGCNDEGVLNHCRAPGVHFRGCWVVDLVLGKE